MSSATGPSTLDVYVNGALVRSEAIDPGTFELKNLPVTDSSDDHRPASADPAFVGARARAALERVQGFFPGTIHGPYARSRGHEDSPSNRDRSEMSSRRTLDGNGA